MRVSVVITTRNRAELLKRAIDSVLSQQGVDLELVVVDDGSEDDTPAVLAAIRDERLRAIRRTNGGLSAARNTGIAAVSGDWVAFLDDDDMALPGWLMGLSELTSPEVGIVCCAAEYRTREGVLVETSTPGPMGPLFDDRDGLFIAGTFAARVELLRAVGGYDERLTCSHQFDLFMRLMPVLAERGWVIHNTDRPLVHLERRPANERPMASPAALYQGTRVLLESHRDRIARDPRDRASLHGVLGVSAARLGKWSEARAALLTSARVQPRRLRYWLRFGAACIPPVGRRVWELHADGKDPGS